MSNRLQWAQDAALLEEAGAYLPGVEMYRPPEWGRDYRLAMDAGPIAMQTTASAGIPAFLSTTIDPTVFEVLFAPTKGSKILGEARKGDWTMQTAMFPVLEHVGEVSSYGDWNNNGHTGANAVFPQRQAYLFQTIKEYGELELERAGLARINWASEIDKAAATIMNRFLNLTYFFGVAGLQNYGLLNDPSLSASLAPGVKAAGNGNKWISGNTVNATANEVYTDIQSMFIQLVGQTGGLVDQEAQLTLAMSPTIAIALTATNSFNVNVDKLLRDNFPNIKIETAVQYGALSSTNPQGVAAGNLVQMIVRSIEGQDTGYCAFNEKMRQHPVIRDMSAFKQKVTGGTWGAIIRQPFAISSMVGV